VITGIQRDLFAVAGLVLALALSAFAGYGQGRAAEARAAAERMQDYRDQVHAREQEQQRALAAANEQNRQQEQAHEHRIADLRADFARTAAQQAARDRRTIDDLYSGYQRLRLQVTSRAPGPGAGATGAAACGADGDGRAELAPEAAASLYRIAADGDDAIRRLTALQGWAQSAVELCGARPKE
jgi:hypothetical protein